MVKHNQLAVKGAPWLIQGEGGERLVFQTGPVFFLGFSFLSSQLPLLLQSRACDKPAFFCPGYKTWHLTADFEVLASGPSPAIEVTQKAGAKLSAARGLEWRAWLPRDTRLHLRI